MAVIHDIHFVTSFDKLRDMPADGPPEVAFVGRSNAGKSSAINAMANRKRLAYVSRTPGRTQLINFFAWGGRGILVDLPGYGFAKVPEAMRRNWNALVGGYIEQRASLAGLVVIMDARHPMKPLDEEMLDWVAPRQIPVHILLSKADKLSRNDALQTLARVRRGLATRPVNSSVQLFSSLDRQGVDEAIARISAMLAGVAAPAPAPADESMFSHSTAEPESSDGSGK
jgi:GTP-binding protein